MPVRDLKPMEWVIHVAPNGGVTIYANRTDPRPIASHGDMEEACGWLQDRWTQAVNEADPPRGRVPREETGAAVRPGGGYQPQDDGRGRPEPPQGGSGVKPPHGRPAVQLPQGAAELPAPFGR